MLPGYAGHLVSEGFLEEKLANSSTELHKTEPHLVRTHVARWRRSCQWLGPASALDTIWEAGAVPLLRALGFEHLSTVEHGEAVILGTARAGSRPVALLVAPWAARLQPLWRLAVSHAIRRSAAWSLLFNGTHLRIVDAGRPYARRFVEFDIDLMLDDERVFGAFWLLAHVSAFEENVSCRQGRLQSIVDASQRHAIGVSRSLRVGVLSASAEVLGALINANRSRSGRTPVGETFEQALTIVYRMLFLLFAEARGLVPLWHRTYRDSYSFESLRAVAEGAHGAAGLWDALRAMARLAHAGCRAGDLRVTAFNGRLFAPARTPLAERRGLDDEAARRAILALSTRPAIDRAGRDRIAYRDLGVEQLGAVYETLLDYEPRIQSRDGGRQQPSAVSVSLVAGSAVRKSTGSFYTPQPIAHYLIRRTLGPLVQDAAPDRILRLRILDPAMGSGAFLVSACRYLADAYEAALIRTGACAGGDLGDAERVAIRRTIAERCVYGVDVNPMAVQLARLSLWLATLASDRPLTFLDHHLQTGDSLVGAWLSNLRHAPTSRKAQRIDDQPSLPLFDDGDFADALRAALPIRFSLENVGGDTLDQVRAKEQALAVLTGRNALLSKWKRVADLWCAPWFAGSDRPVPASAFRSLADVILSGDSTLAPRVADAYLAESARVAEVHHPFHWELEFPEVFFAADGSRLPHGGFDAVIGNPPWDMIRADAGSTHQRAESRTAATRLLRFTRDAGVYRAQSNGHANRYQLFVERSIALTRHGGRMGLVVPSGLVSDHGSSSLRQHLFDRCDVDAIVGFDNHKGVFPIHRSTRFVLVTAARGAATRTIACRLGEQDPASLETVGEEPAATCPWFPIRLSPVFLKRISGVDLAIPDLRSVVDLAILERAATLFAPLGNDRGWGASFGRELNATDDRDCFGPAGAGLPVVEGKQIEPFRTDLASARWSIRPQDARTRLDPARYQRPRLAYRDVASATNRLTLIAAILPAGCVSTHTVFCLRARFPLRTQYFLCGLFNSFIVNYFARLRVTTHVTTGIVEGLFVPGAVERPRAFREISMLARRLSLGPDPVAAARLQGLAASLYQVSVREFEHVLATFPLIATEEREAALRAFAMETRGAPR
jgi:hypothetical protein